MDEQLIERLGTYYVYFDIGQRFGYTFEQYLAKYVNSPAACTVAELRNKKAATTAIVTA
ncbi:hypothetical protein P9B03_08505 [Metasolibacillus meyeri]|uniref:HTH araC/xylS-type domain-containing protein n=1 Tax=Metasolibacillus meyeri TaxID=1071052 RepID=A0AAW9NIM9_9BACL|nr:hypothetical protein [Metasolibacillus meyeri]MEC1178519.1 hypothetical protein [Metasolibacillus meyeri]